MLTALGGGNTTTLTRSTNGIEARNRNRKKAIQAEIGIQSLEEAGIFGTSSKSAGVFKRQPRINTMILSAAKEPIVLC
jgi:hypothetical protein